jgi:CheY-like chemotaxis protein
MSVGPGMVDRMTDQEQARKLDELDRFPNDPDVPMQPQQPDPAVILVVEDDQLVRETVAEHLTDCGYRVAQAASAEEAEALLEAGLRVDCVFTDVVMPGKNGFELARWIHSQHPKVPILLTSGYDSVARRAASTPYGEQLLQKPYHLGQVVQAIETTLQATSTSQR